MEKIRVRQPEKEKAPEGESQEKEGTHGMARPARMSFPLPPNDGGDSPVQRGRGVIQRKETKSSDRLRFTGPVVGSWQAPNVIQRNLKSGGGEVSNLQKSFNGITGAENAAVKQLYNVDLHSKGAKMEMTSSSDKRLTNVGASSLTQGGNALVGNPKDRYHEMRHMVQQHTQTIKPTTTINGQKVNTDRHLEADADSGGQKIKSLSSKLASGAPVQQHQSITRQGVDEPVIQRQVSSGVIQRNWISGPRESKGDEYKHWDGNDQGNIKGKGEGWYRRKNTEQDWNDPSNLNGPYNEDALHFEDDGNELVHELGVGSTLSDEESRMVREIGDISRLTEYLSKYGDDDLAFDRYLSVAMRGFTRIIPTSKTRNTVTLKSIKNDYPVYLGFMKGWEEAFEEYGGKLKDKPKVQQEFVTALMLVGDPPPYILLSNPDVSLGTFLLMKLSDNEVYDWDDGAFVKMGPKHLKQMEILFASDATRFTLSDNYPDWMTLKSAGNPVSTDRKAKHGKFYREVQSMTSPVCALHSFNTMAGGPFMEPEDLLAQKVSLGGDVLKGGDEPDRYANDAKDVPMSRFVLFDYGTAPDEIVMLANKLAGKEPSSKDKLKLDSKYKNMQIAKGAAKDNAVLIDTITKHGDRCMFSEGPHFFAFRKDSSGKWYKIDTLHFGEDKISPAKYWLAGGKKDTFTNIIYLDELSGPLSEANMSTSNEEVIKSYAPPPMLGIGGMPPPVPMPGPPPIPPQLGSQNNDDSGDVAPMPTITEQSSSEVDDGNQGHAPIQAPRHRRDSMARRRLRIGRRRDSVVRKRRIPISRKEWDDMKSHLKKIRDMSDQEANSYMRKHYIMSG